MRSHRDGSRIGAPLATYVTRVCERRSTFLDPLLQPVESALYRLLGVHADQEMSAVTHAGCLLLFGAGCSVLLFLILMLQHALPGAPSDAYLTTPMRVDLAANTAVSLATTTTWQAYAGESTLRYLSQVIGLVAQNFLAGAAGLAVGFAFIRGFARESADTIGNFLVDLVRSLLWVLLPLGLVGSLALLCRASP
jgi:potassium-transporting ATPase potassium-binding subunit